MSKVYLYIIFSFSWIFYNCIGCNEIKAQQNMDYVIGETETSITTLSGYMVRGAVKGYTDLENQDDAFSLTFDINKVSKDTPNSYIHSRHSMEVRKEDGIYKSRSIMESSSFIIDGQNTGHKHPTLQWIEDSLEFTQNILGYYWENKDNILILGSSPDTSQFPKIDYKLIVSEDRNHLVYVTDIVLKDAQFHQNKFNNFTLLVSFISFSKTTNYKRELLSYQTSVSEIKVSQRGDYIFHRPDVFYIYYSSQTKSGSTFRRNSNGDFEEQVINYQNSWSPEHLYGDRGYLEPVLKYFFDNNDSGIKL